MSKKLLIASATLLGLAGAVLPAVSVLAAEEQTTAQINGVISDTISVAVSGDVTINIIPTTSGTTETGSHNVTVSTNNATGYHLQLGSNTANSNLTSGANSIAPTSGTFAAPAAIGTNSWGYRVGTFTAGNYAGVPATASPDTIKTVATPVSGDVTAVEYAINATTAKPNGTYTNTVRYTAVTNN